MEHYLLDLAGIQVSYYVGGNCEKPTLVCLHGLAGSAEYSFTELSQRLTEHFHLIFLDQPGHGKTTPFLNEEDYLFSKLADWYEKVFDTIVDKPFYILGHSWGADVALHYAKHYPSRVKGVILLDGAYTFPEFQEEMTFAEAYDGWNAYLDHASYQNWEEIIREYKNFTKRWNHTIERSITSIFQKNERYELIATKFTVLSIIKAFFAEPFSAAYPYINSPLLLLHAEEPKELQAAREIGITHLSRDVKDVTIIPINHAGHMVQWDKPEEVASEIIKWTENKEAAWV